MSTPLETNTEELQEVLQQVYNLPDSIDTSDADAAASDIASGKTAYVNGTKVTGNVREAGSNYYVDDENGVTGSVMTGGQTVSAKYTMDQDTIFRKGNPVELRFPVSALGLSDGNGSGGLVVKSGSTTEQTFDTGLSSISYVVLYKTSHTATGMLEGFFAKDECRYIYCGSYTAYSKTVSFGTDTSKYSFDGGTFNLSATGIMGFSSGETYYWHAFGTE